MSNHERKITVNALTRVEGEGALKVVVQGDQIQDVQLSIYEPPRFFEALLAGRAIEEVPDITARICGICPVAYQMTAVHALEQALGIEVTSEIRRLRRLLYCAEWIESHALHVFMLSAPDFFGCDSGIELAKQFPEQVEDGLQLRKAGNTMLEVLGGRAIHPVNVCIGGFYRSPDRERLSMCLPELNRALDIAQQATQWIAGFEFPVFDEDCELVALHHADEYPMNEGQIASNRYPAIDVEDYHAHFAETQVAHSTALHSSRQVHQTPYLLGPLARLTLNRSTLLPLAAEADQRHFPRNQPSNRFHSILARMIEVIHCLEESIQIIESYRTPSQSRVAYEHRNGHGCAATEAPRGMIYHRYEIGDDGLVKSSEIVPPTSQNQRQIESDLHRFLPSLLHETDETIAAEAEKLIRTYDPCISCSTHFLRLTMERSE